MWRFSPHFFCAKFSRDINAILMLNSIHLHPKIKQLQ